MAAGAAGDVLLLRDVKSKGELDGLVGGGRAVVAHFWAAWCEPCKHMDAVLTQLAAENAHAHFVRVEAEELPEVSEQYEVASVPLFIVFKDGKVVARVEGANAPELAHKVAVHVAQPNQSFHPGSSSGVGATASSAQIINALQATLAAGGGAIAPNPTTTANGTAAAAAASGPPASIGGGKEGLTPELERRLRGLTASQPVMLFMKGVPDAPRCGFSSKVVGVLKETGVPFGSFDILSDDDVRQGLKVLSDWPTFPQLYANGELLGGCDIVLEMHRSGDLRKTLAEAVGGSAGAAAPPAATLAAGREANGGAEGSLEERLKQLTTTATTMLFMKGSPDEPQCRFSRRVVDALREEGVSFSSFDILKDEAVRQGLKTFSQWPTFPQLYHKGEFIGGCDIVTELRKSGELKVTLAP